MLMTDFAAGLPGLALGAALEAKASSLKRFPSVSPNDPMTPTYRNSRRWGRQMWSRLLHHDGFHLLIAILSNCLCRFDRQECRLDARNQFYFKFSGLFLPSEAQE